MGWEALAQWGQDAVQIEPFTSGVANDVWSVRLCGQLAVGRLGRRSDADLAWEAELLQYLHRHGLAVPLPIPTVDGRLFVDGLMVMRYLEGEPPETPADWRRVAETLRQLHRLTRDWPQRPGWRSSTDLLQVETGTKVNLAAMPAEGVARCRAAWARLADRHTCVVHGDSNNPGNILMTAERVALIDWDESHVDAPDLDLVLPGNAAHLEEQAYDVARPQPPGKPPSVGTTNTRSGAWPRYARSDLDDRHDTRGFEHLDDRLQPEGGWCVLRAHDPDVNVGSAGTSARRQMRKASSPKHGSAQFHRSLPGRPYDRMVA